MKESDLPGRRIREMRQDRKMTLKDLAERCNPPMDFSTVGRIEKNKGYTKDSLERFAEVMGCTVSDFFLPESIKGYTGLPSEARCDISKYVNVQVMAHKNQQETT